MRLNGFNDLDAGVAADLVRPCLDVQRWVLRVVGRRPYRSVEDLLDTGWTATYPLSAAEFEAAIAHRHSFTPELARVRVGGQQAGHRDLRQALAAGVARYEDRFGRPFLIRATGRSDHEVLTNLHSRLSNDADTEDRVLAYHLRQIALAALATTVVP